MAVTNCPGRRYRTQGADICTMQRQLFLFNVPRDEVQGWVLCTRITNYLPCLKTLLIWSLGSNKAWNSVGLNKKLWGWPVFGQLPPALFAVSSSLPEQREPSYSWQIAPHVGLSMKSLPVFSSSHISNAFFLKAIFLKKKSGTIQKIFSWLLRENSVCSWTSGSSWAILFSHYCQEKRS